MKYAAFTVMPHMTLNSRHIIICIYCTSLESYGKVQIILTSCITWEEQPYPHGAYNYVLHVCMLNSLVGVAWKEQYYQHSACISGTMYMYGQIYKTGCCSWYPGLNSFIDWMHNEHNLAGLDVILILYHLPKQDLRTVCSITVLNQH
jgi:hypothetical protein